MRGIYLNKFPIALISLGVLLAAPLAYASYLPGETLDPSCLPTDSTCIVSTVVASSTANSFPYYAANGSVLSATSSLTILTNNNVGIGTSSPAQPLSVTGKIYTTGGIQFPDGSLQTAAAAAAAVGTQGQIGFYNVNGSVLSGTSTVTILQNGNVGIGTTSPYAALSVAGSTGVVANMFTATSTTATSTFMGAITVGMTTSNSNYSLTVASRSASDGVLVMGNESQFYLPALRLTTDGANYNAINGIALSSAQIIPSASVGDYILAQKKNFNLLFATNGVEQMRITNTGNVGIGTTSPYARLTVWGPDSAATTSALTVANSASTTVFSVYDNGNATYSGSIFQSSDRGLKTNITSLDASSSLAAVLGLNPVSYTRLDQSEGGTNLGFIAQDVQQIFPELVTMTSPTALTPDGTFTLNYVGLIAPIVEAIKTLAGEVGAFAQSVTTAVLNAGTGNFTNVNTDNLCVKKSDGSNVCITGDELSSLLNNQGASPALAPPPLLPPPPPPDPSSDTPPVVITDVDVIATASSSPAVSDTPPPDSTAPAPADSPSSVDDSSSSGSSSDTIVPTDSSASTTTSSDTQ